MQLTLIVINSLYGKMVEPKQYCNSCKLEILKVHAKQEEDGKTYHNRCYTELKLNYNTDPI